MGEIKVIFQDDERMSQLNTGHQVLAFFDPRADTPIDEELEGLMDMVGALNYLIATSQQLGVTITPPVETLNNFSARRAARLMWRSCSDYQGERFIQ